MQKAPNVWPAEGAVSWKEQYCERRARQFGQHDYNIVSCIFILENHFIFKS